MTVLANEKSFEEDFKRACRTHNVTAVFVIARDEGKQGSMLVVGGHAQLSDYVEARLTASTVESQKPKH